VDWHAIDWQKAHRNVSRLQARIVKAQQAGRRGTVQALQRLLTHSFSGKTLAVRRVTESQGKRTPGVDGVTWDTPEKKAAAVRDLRQRGYHPRPLRRVYIPKSNGTLRPLGIPTLKDRAMQALYLLALDPVAETTGDPHSYGFRPARSPADALRQCHTIFAHVGGPRWALEGDIRRCFDELSHDWLVAHVPMDTAILRKWLKAGFLEQDILYPTDEGTPQGGVISPVLANLALDGLEGVLQRAFPKTLRRSRHSKVNLVRYADDFIVSGASKEVLEGEVIPVVEAFLKERGLSLSREKTGITRIEDGFDFLGQNVRLLKGKCITRPSKKSVTAFLGKARGIVRANKQATAGSVVVRLNPLIQGWANYHRHAASKETFNSVDTALFRLLWRWARRRHPKKPRRWIREKYFHTEGERGWVFGGTVREPDGSTRPVHLRLMARTPIRRHTAIRGTANPYDPQDEPYFEQRLGVKMAAHLQGRRTLLYLWKQQRGRCPRCGQKLTEITGWHNHHRVWRVYGGSDRAENRVLLHPTCHRQLHSQDSRAGRVPGGAFGRLEPDEAERLTSGS
jgi:RNA-directed DNA polymerase